MQGLGGVRCPACAAGTWAAGDRFSRRGLEAVLTNNQRRECRAPARAVAGFRSEDLTITAKQNLLVIAGEGAKVPNDEQRQFLHRGLAMRSFERRFELADHVKVAGANLADGLLTIDLYREVPESMRPRRIEITRGTDQDQRQIESERKEPLRVA